MPGRLPRAPEALRRLRSQRRFRLLGGGAGPKAQGPEGPEVRRQPALGAEEGHRPLRHLEMGSRDF